MTQTVSRPAGAHQVPLPLDVEAIRADFPILTRTVRDGKRLVYLDSGATSQKPRSVLDAERWFYENINAAPHRGAHQLAEEATDAYEAARATIAGFIGAADDEVVFTRNSTEAINLVAYALSNAATAKEPEFRRYAVGQGDEIVVTEMEHHANLVPWQQLCERTGATLRWLGLTDDGRLDLSDLADRGQRAHQARRGHPAVERPGHDQPAGRHRRPGPRGGRAGAGRRRAVGAAPAGRRHRARRGLPGLLRAQDARPHRGRRAVGPVRGARRAAAVPDRRLDDRGRPDGGQHLRRPAAALRGRRADDRAGRSGWARPWSTCRRSAWTRWLAHEEALTAYALEQLQAIPGVTVIGPPDTVARGGAISFTVEGIHPHDVGQVLDDLGIAVRVGHHCAWPVVRRYGVPATTRATFYVYTGYDDVDALVDGRPGSPALLRRCTR